MDWLYFVEKETSLMCVSKIIGYHFMPASTCWTKTHPAFGSVCTASYRNLLIFMKSIEPMAKSIIQKSFGFSFSYLKYLLDGLI